MALIESIPLEQALASHVIKEPSARTFRTLRIAQDAQAVFAAVLQKGAASIELTDEGQPTSAYLNCVNEFET